MKKQGITRLLILTTILSLSLFTNHLPWLPSTTQAHAQGIDQAIVYVNGPYNNASVNDPNHTLKTVTFGVYIQLSNVSIIGYSVVIGYPYPQLNASASAGGIGYQTNNILGTQTQVVENCVDGAGNCSHQPNGPGYVAFALTVLGGYKSVPTITKGFLFNVTFGINNSARGLFQVHVILAVYAPAGTESSVDAQIGEDGYYTNIACPPTSQTPCRPPDVSVQVTPRTPSQGSPATFNVTVVEHNLGAHPTKYAWNWGDGSGQTQTNLTRPIQHIFAITSEFGNSNCVNQAKCPVALTVYDSAGVVWQITIIVNIQHILIEVNVGEIDAKDNSGQSVQGVFVQPGTAVQISAFIANRGTIAENANVTINLEDKNLTDHPQQVSLQPFGYAGSQFIVNATWNTGGYTPRAYAVVVRITSLNSFGCNPNLPPPCVRGNPNGTSILVGSVYVLLIAPQVTGGLSLSLLQTTGLGALILVGIAVALARLLKKPSYETEPL